MAHEISMLIVRQYEQSCDDKMKTSCLNLIDQMERVGYFGKVSNFQRLIVG